MKTVSLLSAMIMLPAASLLAKAPSELEILRTRIDVQERRISQLENALNRLQGNPVIRKAAKAVPVTEKTGSKVATASTSSGTKEYVVAKGDILTRIAYRHHTTVAAIKKENGLKSDALRVGQKLKIPATSLAAITPSAKAQPQAVVKKSTASKSAVATSTKSTKSVKSTTGKHVVKAGETFYGIARQYKMSEATLQAANPKAKPTRLQIGQVLVIDASTKSTSKAVAQSTAKKPKQTVQKSTKSAQSAQSSKSSKSSQTAKTTKSSSVKKSPAKKTPVVSSAPPTVKKPLSIRTITVQKQMTYGAFASQHGASTSQLNSLNGLDLSKSTMLAKGSELYVPQY